MKYVLFALGLLLLLFGSYSVYVGSGIIEVERGWASVIAGTTAVVGGLLTLGLAWIIKTLEQLRVTIQAQEMMNMAVRTAIPTALHPRETLVSAADRPVPAPAWPPHTEAVQDLATTKKEFAEPARSHLEPWPEVETFEESAYGSHAAKINEAAQPQVEEAPAAVVRPESSTSIKSFWHRVTKESYSFRPAAQPAIEEEPAIEAAPPLTAPVPEPVALAETQTEAQQTAEISGDWLDHALADLDAALAQTPHPADAAAAAEYPAPAAAETDIDVRLDEVMPVAEPVHVEQTVEVDEAVHFEEAVQPEEVPHLEEAAPLEETVQQHETPPPLAPEPVLAEPSSTAAAQEPAVIGRYEAEGTTYIMFADGSIEAQSERGVARFKSMADLKAYFESQDAT